MLLIRAKWEKIVTTHRHDTANKKPTKRREQLHRQQQPSHRQQVQG